MTPTQRALKMHWQVDPGNHSLTGDLIAEQISQWNEEKRQSEESATGAPKWESGTDTRFWR